MESILTSIKKLLGMPEEDKSFDQDIIMCINTVFLNLNQIGIGTSDIFSIEDDLTKWNEFLGEDEDFNAVKSYMHLKVRLLFDPPQNQSIISAFERQIKELEWRLRFQAEHK